MADVNSAVKYLKIEFPDAQIGVSASRPFAKLADGRLYGILFGEPGDRHAGDPRWERGPVAIVQFPSGQLDSHNFEIVKSLI